MTPEELRELDHQVEQVVFGREPCEEWHREYGRWAMAQVDGEAWMKEEGDCKHLDSPSAFGCYPAEYPPLRSTNPAAIQGVIDKLINTPGPDGDYYDVLFDITSVRTICVVGELADYRVKVEAPTLGQAVCMAALEVFGE
jgi:hypothetical protein